MTVTIKAQTPKTAARRTHRALQAYAKRIGYSTEHLVLNESGPAPMILWEEGPFEWTMALSGGYSLSAGEFPELGGYTKPCEIKLEDGDWFAEPQTHYSMAFYKA